jgi:hypothetical protein
MCVLVGVGTAALHLILIAYLLSLMCDLGLGPNWKWGWLYPFVVDLPIAPLTVAILWLIPAGYDLHGAPACWSSGYVLAASAVHLILGTLMWGGFVTFVCANYQRSAGTEDRP